MLSSSLRTVTAPQNQVPSAQTVVPSAPPSVKSTSRGRTYRIPNTSDVAVASGLVGNTSGDSATIANNGTNTSSESFFWATREIAALDFLMNIPLCAEREIVRAGLSGERWHRHHDQDQKTPNIIHQPNDGGDIEMGTGWIISETNQTNFDLPSQSRAMSNFSVNRNSTVEEEGTLSTNHSYSLGSEKGGNSNALQTIAPGGGMRWWDKLILMDKRFFSAANQQVQRRELLEMEERELERPTDFVNDEVSFRGGPHNNVISHNARRIVNANCIGIPGRRLDGRDAVTLSIPAEFRTRPVQIRTVARQAAVREWEIKVAWHGVDVAGKSILHQHHRLNAENKNMKQALLDGRVFFSSKKSYPIAVFSAIKYEPQKEKAARRRKKLEELGGGGTQFVLPERDWRGTSYRALLPRVDEQNKAFNRLLAAPLLLKKDKVSSARSKGGLVEVETSSDDSETGTAFISSDESDAYVPGFLDDPKMIQGRHRNVMIGDKFSGPIVSSTIQFVKPSLLKAELNKQFRERFDQWEPPKSQRKFIGAKVIDGTYTLIDPTDVVQDDLHQITDLRRPRSGSLADRDTIRMPPSLTLSKIRSLKQQALVACVRSQIELSTLALACVYFERLCLDCRVDKSNRRLSFAACLFLAAKVNESNTMIAFDPGAETKSWVKPSKKSGKIFESLIVFFTHDWSISLKQLYAAEWIVFTALQFSLKSTPSQVAFHFKRLLKVLEWNPRSYLGNEMYCQWQECLIEELRRREHRNARREMRKKKSERKLLELQHKLHLQQSEEAIHRRASVSSDSQIQPIHHSKFSSIELNRTKESLQEHAVSPGKTHFAKGDGTPAVRGLLSRLSRSKQESYGKDLDTLPKQDKKLEVPLIHSHSVPNLSLLAAVLDDTLKVRGIQEIAFQS